MRNKPLILLSIAILLVIGLSGCSADLIKPEQPLQSGVITQNFEQNIGQTFTAHYDGLQAIRLEIVPIDISEGEILFHLRRSPNDADDLRTVRINAQDLITTGSHTFHFLPIPDSNKSEYYLALETLGQSQIDLRTGPAESYLNGSLYQNDVPQETQLTFGLGYDPMYLLFGVFQEFWTWIGWIFFSIILFVLPGWAILIVLWPDWEKLLWAEKTGLAAGLSLAIYPVFMLWTHLVGLQLGRLYAWLPIFGGIIFLSLRGWKKIRTAGSLVAAFSSTRSKISGYDLILWIILVLILGTRFWGLRFLDLPLWGDGYQHTMITQLLVDNNGIFNSWLPYAELNTFTYHFGFHSMSAVLHWITGLDVPKSVLLTGQILNFLAVLGLYPLSMRLTHNRWSALFTIMLAGLFFSMPMAYINWGRYTQLAGLVILPALVCINWFNLDDPKFNKSTIFLSGFVFCGLALTHYRVLIIATLFIPAWFIFNFRMKYLALQIRKVFWMGVFGVLLAVPWLVQVFSGKLTAIVEGQMSAPAGAWSDLSLVTSSLSSYLPLIAWVSLLIIICWGIFRRERNLAIIIVWWLLVFLVTNPQIIRLPGSGVITNFTIFIAAYFPASLMIGSAFGWLFDQWILKFSSSTFLSRSSTRSVLYLTGLFLLFGFCLLGAKTRLNDLQISQHTLAAPPDLRAARWIQENLLPNERLLVNSFFAYNGTAVVGSDGGWWLTLTAGRLTSLPPLNYVSEKGIRPDFYQSTNDLTALIEAEGLNDPEVLDELNRRGLTHVYIGQLQGSVNSGGEKLDLEELRNSPHYAPVYQQDRVWIFKVIH